MTRVGCSHTFSSNGQQNVESANRHARCSNWLSTSFKNASLLVADAKSFPRQLRITNGSPGYSAITCGLAGPFDCAVAYNNDDDDKTQGRR